MCYQKAPGLGQKRNAGLTYSSTLAVISFKIVSYGKYTAIPSFFTRFKSTVQVIFLNAVEPRSRFPLDVNTASKHCPFRFNLENKPKSRGAKSGYYLGWGMITMLLLITNVAVFSDVWAGALS
jgi:hypothetical protein